jgi:ABC-2 type transport system permease protein
MSSTTSTFTPRPGAAPLSRQVAAQARMEARLMLRNGEQLLLAIVIPVIVLVGGVAGADRLGLDLDGHRAVDVLTPGVLALAVMSTAFTSIAIATGFERRYGVIKRLGASPLPRHGLLLGKVLALLNVVALQLVVLVAVALALGWRPTLEHPATTVGAALLAVAAGTWAFASLGLFVAGVLRAEATLALANLVYLLLMAAGGVVLPTSSYGAASAVIQWLPSAALGDLMRAALVDAQLDLTAFLVLLAWGAVGTLLTARTFTWE